MVFDKSTLNRLYRYCLSLTGESDAAYDLMQGSLEKYLRSQAEADGSATPSPANPMAYLFRIVRNGFIDMQRRARVRQHDSLEEEILRNVDPSMVTRTMRSLEDVTIHRQQVRELLGLISPEHRELLFLWAVEGYTIQEIADLTQTPKGTLLSRVHRLRQQIVAALQSGDEDGSHEALG